MTCPDCFSHLAIASLKGAISWLDALDLTLTLSLRSLLETTPKSSSPTVGGQLSFFNSTREICINLSPSIVFFLPAASQDAQRPVILFL